MLRRQGEKKNEPSTRGRTRSRARRHIDHVHTRGGTGFGTHDGSSSGSQHPTRPRRSEGWTAELRIRSPQSDCRQSGRRDRIPNDRRRERLLAEELKDWWTGRRSRKRREPSITTNRPSAQSGVLTWERL